MVSPVHKYKEGASKPLSFPPLRFWVYFYGIPMIGAAIIIFLQT